MILGYIISGEFNDSHFFDSDDKELPLCKKCGYVTDFEYISPIFKLKKRIYDISATYDGRTIVSNNFKKFCEDLNYKGLEFIELPNDKGFYIWHRILRFCSVDSLKSAGNERRVCFIRV